MYLYDIRSSRKSGFWWKHTTLLSKNILRASQADKLCKFNFTKFNINYEQVCHICLWITYQVKECRKNTAYISIPYSFLFIYISVHFYYTYSWSLLLPATQYYIHSFKWAMNCTIQCDSLQHLSRQGKVKTIEHA